MARTYESLSDRETDGASYTVKRWSDNDGIDRDQVALPKNDNLHAEQCFLESVVEKLVSRYLAQKPKLIYHLQPYMEMARAGDKQRGRAIGRGALARTQVRVITSSE